MRELAHHVTKILVERIEHLPGERAWLAHMFWGEQAFLSSTMVNKHFVLRMCILNYTTTWDDVRETLEAVERCATDARE